MAKAEKARKEAEQREAREREEKRKKEAAASRKSNKSKSSADNKSKSDARGSASGESAAGRHDKDYASARKRRPRGEAAASSSAADFATMRGSLPRPVSGAFRITSQFGRHSLPDLPDVMYDNPGIDAEVSSGASALAVYAGTVSGVYMIPGFSTVVIVNHGDYYTVYGNLGSSAVKVGDRVKQGQTLGKVTTDPDNPGHSEIHFEVWKGKEKQNPAAWIK